MGEPVGPMAYEMIGSHSASFKFISVKAELGMCFVYMPMHANCIEDLHFEPI